MPTVERLGLRKLIERVEDGHHVEWPWALLKDNFPAESDDKALRQMQSWAVKNGIAVKLETQTVRLGKSKAPIRVAVFGRKRKPPIRAR